MNNNYHINLNPKEPSSEQIAKHMDFDALLEKVEKTKQEQAKPKVRRLVLYIGSAVAAALIGAVFFIGNVAGPGKALTEYSRRRNSGYLAIVY